MSFATRIFLPCITVCFLNPIVYAQKLPNKQEKSLWAMQQPKFSDANQSYQAYNSATEIFYSISNDDKNLYLEVKAAKPVIIQKIISYKLTFIITNLSDKKAKRTFAAKFPYLNLTDRQLVIRSVKSQTLKRDSMINILNKQVVPDAREIAVNNSLELKDSLVSVYNESGIKAACHFDNDMAYIYHLAIPFKLLNADAKSSDLKIGYQIKLNGIEENGVNARLTADGRATIRSGASGYPGVIIENTPDTIALDYPTDVSGEYILAKQP